MTTKKKEGKVLRKVLYRPIYVMCMYYTLTHRVDLTFLRGFHSWSETPNHDRRISDKTSEKSGVPRLVGVHKLYDETNQPKLNRTKLELSRPTIALFV